MMMAWLRCGSKARESWNDGADGGHDGVGGGGVGDIGAAIPLGCVDADGEAWEGWEVSDVYGAPPKIQLLTLGADDSNDQPETFEELLASMERFRQRLLECAAPGTVVITPSEEELRKLWDSSVVETE